MTVASDVQDVTHITDGSTVGFAISFYFLANSHVVADLIDNSGMVASLVYGTDYTIIGAGNPNGGTLTTLSVWAAGYRLRIYRSVPVTQETQYQQNDAFPAKTTEKALDKLTMIDQQHSASIGRALQVPMSDVAPKTVLPKASERANSALGFDSNGDPYPLNLTIGSFLVPVVNTLNEARLVSKLIASDLFTRGRRSPGDGGNGHYFKVADTAPAGWENGGTQFVAADGAAWELSFTGTVSVKVFGAYGDAQPGHDDTAAIQAALDWLSSQPRGGALYYPSGQYLVSSTLRLQSSYVRQFGDGVSASLIVTKTDFDTMVIGRKLIVPMVGVDVVDIGFYHTNEVVRNSRHLVTICPLQSTFRNAFTNGAYGHVNYGGQGIRFDKTFAPGYYDPGTNPVFNAAQGITLAGAATLPAGEGYSMGPGAVDLPTNVEFIGIYLNGPRMKGWQYAVAIFAGEHITFSSDYYLGQATVNNLHIEQDAFNKLILEVTLEPGGYIDAAGQAAVYIGGPNGNGSQYIGSVEILCNLKGQNGDGQRGLVVDGANRGGDFPQAVQNLTVRSKVSGFALDGILVAGGSNITIDSKCWGNSVSAINAGSGLYIGAHVNVIDVTGHYGGDTFGRNNGGQAYGVYTDPAAINVTIQADLRGNQIPTNTITNAGDTGYRIVNSPGFSGGRGAIAPAMPGSGVNFTNPYGTPCSVLIYSGAVSTINLNGSRMFSATVNAPIPVAPGDVLNITYSTTPSWTWWPQ